MTDKIERERTFDEEIQYFKQQIKEIFDNYHNPDGSEDRLEICVLRDAYRTVLKAEEEITRQQVEIEQLKFEIAKLLPKGCPYAIQVEVSNKLEAQIKSEAFKEFAERLKEKSFQSFGNYGITRDVVEVCDIDNLIKEMVGDE